MANLFLRFPGNRHKALTFSYDDGPREDVRLIELFRRLGLKATFNLNSGSFPPEEKAGSKTFRLTKKEALDLYSGSGMEVAAHTLTHPRLEEMGAGLAAYEIMKDKENLEEMFGGFVSGIAYPYGTYSDEIVETVRNAGLIYARTIEPSYSFEIPKDWLRLKPTCHHGDERLMELAESFVSADLTGRDRDPLLFYVWGHSFEFDERFGGTWDVIEKFSSYVAGRKDIWYATNGEIFEYIEAFNRLRFSTDRSYVRNESYIPVSFFYNEKDYTAAPGEVLILD
jgi:peptidoglycan/xylan/chitin deacetylase (PgdA/CDA1 family)